MKIRVIALSAALLFATGVYAQNNAPATAPSNNNTMSAQPNGTNGANNGAMQNGNEPNGAMPNGATETGPVGTNYGHGGGGSWGWWGLVGLFGLFGLAGGRRRNDVVRTNENLPPR